MMKRLEMAFSQKERAEELLANLEELKQKGDIDEAQYESMKMEYTRMRDEADAEIEAIKEQLKGELEARQRDLEIYTQELQNLETRFKVGEISADRYRKEEQRAQGKLEKIQRQVTDLQVLYEAKSADEFAKGGEKEMATRGGGSVRMSPSGLSIGDIFRESFELYRSNPIIIVPSLLPVIWVLIAWAIGLAGPWMLLTLLSPEAAMGGFFALMAGLIVSLLIFLILFILAAGMTVEMIREAYEEGHASVTNAWWAALGRIGPLVIGAILVPLLISLGFLLIVPGIVLMFLLWFVPQAIMIEDEGGVSSLRRSFEFFRENAMDAFIMVLVSAGLYSILGILVLIPFIGEILMLAAMPYLIALTTLLYIDRG